MRSSDFIGVAAGFLVSIVGLVILGVASDPCNNTLTDRSSYVGGISVPAQHGEEAPVADDSAVVVENPYGIEICDYWPSRGEKWVDRLALMLLALVSGATAARIGPAVAPWRGALAVGAVPAAVVANSLSTARDAVPIGDIWPWTVPFIASAALLGYIGGAIAWRFARHIAGSDE